VIHLLGSIITEAAIGAVLDFIKHRRFPLVHVLGYITTLGYHPLMHVADSIATFIAFRWYTQWIPSKVRLLSIDAHAGLHHNILASDAACVGFHQNSGCLPLVHVLGTITTWAGLPSFGARVGFHHSTGCHPLVLVLEFIKT
jgi:hypothetical protein